VSLTEWWRQPRQVKRPILVLTAIAAVQAGALLASVWPEPDPWDPIEPLQVQVVANDQPIPYGEPVVVEGVKCYREPVKVSGVVTWATEDPSGTSIVTGRGVAYREQGCVTFLGADAFVNTVPPIVLDADRALRARGVEASWYITGSETPFDADGRHGVTRSWRTESFRLLAEDEQ